MKNIVKFLIIICLTIQPVLAAEKFKTITLDEAIKLFLQENIDLRAKKMDIDEATNNIKVANKLNNPNLNIFYNYGQAGDGNPQQIGLSEDIELFKRDARKNLARIDLKLESDSYAYLQFEKTMDLKEAYVNLVYAKSILGTLKEQQKLYFDLLEITRQRDKNKLAQDVDVIQTEIALNQMITQVNSAELKVRKARYEFNKALNIDNDEIYDVKESKLPLPMDITDGSLKILYAPDLDGDVKSFESILQSALDNRYDIKIAKHRWDKARQNVIVVSRQRIPDLTVMGGYAYQPARYADSNHVLHGAYAGAGLTNIPILYFYGPEIKNAKIQVEQAELDYLSAKNKAGKNLKSAYDAFLTARTNLNVYGTKLVKNSEELIKASKESYAAGSSNLTSLIVMEQSYQTIIMGYMDALADYYNTWLDFLREVNSEVFEIEKETL